MIAPIVLGDPCLNLLHIPPHTRRSPNFSPSGFRAVHRQAVLRRLPSTGVAAFLSGGIDSSIVVAEAQRHRSTPLPTYAVHFGTRYPNELSFAREVADRCDTDHHEVLIRPTDFLDKLRRMIWHLDEPIGDPVTLPNYILAERVAANAQWILNGEGGDPCFGGPKNLTMMLHHWYGGLERGPRFREEAYLASYRRGFEEIPRLLSPDLLDAIDLERDLADVLTPFLQAEEPRSFLNKLMCINMRLKGAHLILPKVERMLAAADLVPLSPLFDEDVMRYSFQVPPTCKVAGGKEKIVLKRAYEADLPHSIINRPKSGMRVPVHFWFQGEMKRYARHMLSRRALRRSGLLNADRVRQLLRYDIEEGQGRYGIRLWMLLTLEMWFAMITGEE